MDSTPEIIRAVWCGRVRFDEALKEQLELREALVAGQAEPTMLLCEHPPSLTMGRRAEDAHLLWTAQERSDRGLEVFETPRGGEATLHAPGQLVVYPVVYVGKRIRAHIDHLADAAIECLRLAGIRGAEMRWEHPGVWVGERKFASVGVHVSRGVAVQGLALNVDVDPTLFGALVSCGMPTVEMASVWPYRDSALAEAPFDKTTCPPLREVARRFAEHFASSRGVQCTWSDRTEP